MSSPSGDNDEPSPSVATTGEGPGDDKFGAAESRPPAKRRFSSTVIEISDTESDDSDVCAVNSYQASADEVKRIRGDDYSSSSSSSDYSSESDESFEDDSILAEDYAASSRAVKAPLNARANRMDDPQFNSNIKSQELIDRLSLHWKEQKEFKSEEVTLTCDPFRLCLLQEFLSNSEMINNIVDDMNTLDWSRKKMDLYEFHQTTDLANLTWQRSIRGIYELLKTEVMSWVSQVTGLTLNSVSASCSLYGPGDHLLVHDDLLSDRRVAFILYLAPWRPCTPRNRKLYLNNIENGAGGDHSAYDLEDSEGSAGWSRRMGGALQQLSRDWSGRPDTVVRSVSPRNNMLAFFQVGPDSFHQVEEVLSLELPRLSINGWFHGPAPGPGAETPGVLDPPEPLKLHNEVVLVPTWLAPTYMSPRSRALVQAQLEQDSEVRLPAVLSAPRALALLHALQEPEVPWEWCGPPNQRHYERLPTTWTDAQDQEHLLRGLLQLFSSTAFARVLADCSDLVLVSHCGLEVQRWSAGCYTLLPPREHCSTARLDAYLHLGGAGGAGGVVSYVALDDAGASAALVQLPPAHNALSLVYADPGAAPFTSYVSRLPPREHPYFYVVTCQYRERDPVVATT